MTELNAAYWQTRWEQGQTGWDMGTPSPALVEYAAQLTRKDLRILIPGAGSCHEADWLIAHGFTDVTVLDWSQTAIDQVRARCAHVPELQLVCANFFEHHGSYDLVLEQTFFCALDPKLRGDYARHMASLIKEGGKLAGLLFDFPLTAEGPPFGGSVEEYLGYFEPYFEVETMERARNSIPPRAGKELFFILRKK